MPRAAFSAGSACLYPLSSTCSTPPVVAAPVPVRTGSGAGPCGSRLEAERTRDRVVIAKIDVEPRRLGGVLRRLPDVGWGSRNRREDGVVQRSWLAGRALKRRQVRRDRVADPQASVHALHLERDGHLLDGVD